jgi:hypothetical protein
MPKNNETKPIAVVVLMVGFHCSFMNSELEQCHKEQKCSGHEHNEPSFIGHWFSFPMLGWPLTPKAEEHRRKNSSG